MDIDTTTGTPVVSSLKTRLLALQVLGGIMVELSDTSPEAHAKCAKVSLPSIASSPGHFHMQLVTYIGFQAFSACNTSKLGVAWGQGYAFPNN